MTYKLNPRVWCVHAGYHTGFVPHPTVSGAETNQWHCNLKSRGVTSSDCDCCEFYYNMAELETEATLPEDSYARGF